MIDYAGNVLGAIDLIVQERMKDLKFDIKSSDSVPHG